jgi:hypothetical protein
MMLIAPALARHRLRRHTLHRLDSRRYVPPGIRKERRFREFTSLLSDQTATGAVLGERRSGSNLVRGFGPELLKCMYNKKVHLPIRVQV